MLAAATRTSHGFPRASVAAAHPFHTRSLPEADLPDLVGGESYEWAAIGDLDAFFKRIYRCAAQHGTAYVQHSAESPCNLSCHDVQRDPDGQLFEPRLLSTAKHCDGAHTPRASGSPVTAQQQQQQQQPPS